MASIVSTSTKFFTDTMVGAPTLNNASGSLIALLDAVCDTGFGIKAITGLTVAAGVATISFAAPASAALPECVIALSGVTGTYASLNGEQRVKSVSTTSVTFGTNLPDGTATLSSASFKIAPLGIPKVFSGTGKAVYRPVDPASTRPYLRILDTAASPATAFHARGYMYETMSDVDTGTNMSPPNALVANGGYWWKTNVNSAAAQAWTVVGDSRGFYFMPCTHSSASGFTNSVVHYFGDLKSFKSGDAYCGAMVCGTLEVNSTPAYGPNMGLESATLYNGWVMRHFTGLGSAVNINWRGVGGSTGGVSGNDNASAALGPFPCPSNNGLLLSEVVVGRGVLSAYGPRGTFPGCAYVPQSGAQGAFPRGTIIDGVGQWAGSRLLAITGGGTLSGANQDFPFFFDISKDWRA